MLLMCQTLTWEVLGPICIYIILLTEDFLSHLCTGIVTALTWPASLLAVASVIDNPWGVCLSRSAEVGKHLAQVLRSRQQVSKVLDGKVRWKKFLSSTPSSCSIWLSIYRLRESLLSGV